MKNTLLSLIALFILSGCEDIYLDDEEANTDNNISVHNGQIPILSSPKGSYVDLSTYLYPNDLTTDKTFYFQKVYSYAQTVSAEFTTAPDIFQRSYTKTINGDITTITEYKDGQKQGYSDIKKSKIFSYYDLKDNNNFKELDIRVAINSKVSDTITDNIQEVCVVVSIGSMDLSSTTYLQEFVRSDLLNNQLKTENGEFRVEQFYFNDMIHIFCGTSDNHTTDTYYSKKYGRVLKLQKDIDKNLLKVEVADVLNVKNE